MTDVNLIEEKIKEVKEEMKKVSVWKDEIPAWVRHFEKGTINTREDFSEWLQFIYLPNRKLQATGKKVSNETDYIVPQAIKFFGEDIRKGKLLRLLIELDSLYKTTG